MPTNYTTILLILWIPSFMTVFTTAPLLSQMNPANFLATHHQRFTAVPSPRLYERPFSSRHGRSMDSQVCSPNLSLDNALHFMILFGKRSAGKLYRRTKGVGTEGDCADVQMCTVQTAAVLLRFGWCRQNTALTSHTDRFVPACRRYRATKQTAVVISSVY
jgi:hypothetical protein